MIKRITFSLALLTAGIVAVVAGQWNNSFPIVAGSSYCATTVNGVCTSTIVAGPTAMTGAETVPMDTNLSGGRSPQTVIATTNTIAAWARGTGLLYTSVAAVAGSAGTSEQTLLSYSLPANTLIAGTVLRIKASFTAAANGNNKTFTCAFGTATIGSGVLTTNAKQGSCELMVTNVSAKSQQVYGNMLVDTTPITGTYAAATQDGTAAITIAFKATGGTTGADITGNVLTVERLGQ